MKENELRMLWHEYLHEGLLPFIVIEGCVSVVAGLLFVMQTNVMSANGLPNRTNLAVEYLGSMSIFNILFAISSVVMLIAMAVGIKIQRKRYINKRRNQ